MSLEAARQRRFACVSRVFDREDITLKMRTDVPALRKGGGRHLFSRGGSSPLSYRNIHLCRPPEKISGPVSVRNHPRRNFFLNARADLASSRRHHARESLHLLPPHLSTPFRHRAAPQPLATSSTPRMGGPHTSSPAYAARSSPPAAWRPRSAPAQDFPPQRAPARILSIPPHPALTT